VQYPTTPAIVSQAAVRRLPRLALLLFCLAYLLPGFIGRDAWKSEDATALGYMAELAQGSAAWWQPTLMGVAPESSALLPYWLGAWMLQIAPKGMDADFLVRLPFVLLLALSMWSTWYGCYHLARSPKAQPVAFAFGGEASPSDYARAMADGALLAFISSLGLAQLSHETTPALAQLGFSSMAFAALAALASAAPWALPAFAIGAMGLSLSGAPILAGLLGLGGALIHFLDYANSQDTGQRTPQSITQNNTSNRRQDLLDKPWRRQLQSLFIALLSTMLLYLTYQMHCWTWESLRLPWAAIRWSGYVQQMVWFTWPAWPLVVWTWWRWRHQLLSTHISRHLALPTWFALVVMVAALHPDASDRKLLLALPALAVLAAFALPTMQRQVTALVDWFTLLFFSGCALIIWIVWFAMHTGFPSQPATNVQRLASGFEAHFSWFTFALGLTASLVWACLVAWRIGKHRAAIWKSLVLPAGGAALCWLLLMTLWLPLLNYAQSYTALVQRTLGQMDPPGCVEVVGLGQGKIAAYQFYGNLQLKPAQTSPICPWLIAEPLADMSAPSGINPAWWAFTASISHPADGNESVLLFRRK
jgi:hypothetical protein